MKALAGGHLSRWSTGKRRILCEIQKYRTVNTTHATSGPVIEDANGDYIFPLYGDNSSYIKKSADGGATWGSLITVASSGSCYRVPLKNGYIYLR